MAQENEVSSTESAPEPTQPPAPVPSISGMLSNLAINIAIPVVILSYFSKPEYLGIKWGLVVALAFPISFGSKDLVQSGKINFFSVIGVVTLLLTGGMGLFEIDPKYIAIKEAAVPGLIGVFTLVSIKTRYPLVKTLILKNPLILIDKVNRALDEHNAHAAFEKSLRNSSIILASSFFLAAFTNYMLAIIVLVSPPGTEAFNQELGKMIALSYPVNVLPSMVVMLFALFYTMKNIEKHTGLKFEDILNIPQK